MKVFIWLYIWRWSFNKRIKSNIYRWMIDNKMLYNTENSTCGIYIKNYILCEMSTFDDEKENMLLNEPINYNEVKFAIKNMKIKKSSGVDNISNKVLKSREITLFLYYFLRTCFTQYVVPVEWSRVIICPIPKDRSECMYDPLNYRGISLLPCITKLYSSILNNRIVKYCDVLDTIVDEQNGFRTKKLMTV